MFIALVNKNIFLYLLLILSNAFPLLVHYYREVFHIIVIQLINDQTLTLRVNSLVIDIFSSQFSNSSIFTQSITSQYYNNTIKLLSSNIPVCTKAGSHLKLYNKAIITKCFPSLEDKLGNNLNLLFNNELFYSNCAYL